MANPVKTWFLAPTRDYPPDGPISLGSIIKDKAHPEEVLCDPLPIPPEMGPWQTHKLNWTSMIDNTTSRNASVFAHFLGLAGVGGEAGVSRDKGAAEVFVVRDMETSVFVPRKSYIKAIVSDPEVAEYLAVRRNRVFLIVGLMVARGASAASARVKGLGLHAHVGVDFTWAGVPLKVGPGGGLRSSTGQQVAFEDASDFVFAFRLLQISKGKTGEPESKPHNEGALFSLVPTSGDEEGVGAEAEPFEAVVEEGTAEVLAVEAASAVDLEGNACVCASVAE